MNGNTQLLWPANNSPLQAVRWRPTRVTVGEPEPQRRFVCRKTPTMISVLGLFCMSVLMLQQSHSSTAQNVVETDLESTLDCSRRTYRHKVIQADSEGRICWDMVSVVSCWGRCDSNEVSDWRFPYKRSHHPVCIHGDRTSKTVTLSNCEDGAKPGTEIHEFTEALTCDCSLCKSSEANCQGLRYNGEGEVFHFERVSRR